MSPTKRILAHGVGRVYKLPVPLYLYLLGSAATVAASFLIRAYAPETLALARRRRLVGPAGVGTVDSTLRFVGLLGLGVTVATGFVYAEGGLALPALLFWIGLVIGMLIVSCVVARTWDAADPWATIETLYGSEHESDGGTPPWWLAPLGVYALFWFELVSGVGFEGRGVVLALAVYTLYTLTLRARYRRAWRLADPLSILFGFAQRIAPFELGREGIYYRGALAGLDRSEPMPRALFSALFILLASTTLDNVRETVGWFDFLRATGLASVPGQVLDSLALAVLALLFLLPFLGVVWIARRWIDASALGTVARVFGWSLIPIGIAYVLAHNVSLLFIGTPALVDQFAELFGFALFEGYSASPQLVWFLEIGLIVGGHVLAVLVAHRTAVRVAHDHRGAVRSQYALTALMSIFTITTLWLLAQPLVTT